MQGGLPQPQTGHGLQSPSPMEGGQVEAAPQLVSQAHLVFAQPLEELDPSDTEQEKVRLSNTFLLLSQYKGIACDNT